MVSNCQSLLQRSTMPIQEAGGEQALLAALTCWSCSWALAAACLAWSISGPACSCACCDICKPGLVLLNHCLNSQTDIQSITLANRLQLSQACLRLHPLLNIQRVTPSEECMIRLHKRTSAAFCLVESMTGWACFLASSTMGLAFSTAASFAWAAWLCSWRLCSCAVSIKGCAFLRASFCTSCALALACLAMSLALLTTGCACSCACCLTSCTWQHVYRIIFGNCHIVPCIPTAHSTLHANTASSNSIAQKIGNLEAASTLGNDVASHIISMKALDSSNFSN